jgi:hypothetical protein
MRPGHAHATIAVGCDRDQAGKLAPRLGLGRAVRPVTCDAIRRATIGIGREPDRADAQDARWWTGIVLSPIAEQPRQP